MGGLALVTVLVLPGGRRPLVARTYVEGPPAGHTAGFGEPSCHECHFENDLNDPQGSLELTGVPDRYAPRRAYTLTVTLSRADVALGGFQITARVADGGDAGHNAGTLSPTDDRVQLSTQEADANPVTYAHHTERGTALTGPDTASWTLDWTAPPQRSAVVLHVAANAANDDASEFGDYIYTTRRVVEPEP